MHHLAVRLGLAGLVGLLAVVAGYLWVRSTLDAGLTRYFGRHWEYSHLSLRVLPPGGTVSSFRVLLEGREVLSVPRIDASLRLGARGIEIVQVAVQGGRVTVWRESDGTTNLARVVEEPGPYVGATGPVGVPVLTVSALTVTYEDVQPSRGVVVREISGVVRPGTSGLQVRSDGPSPRNAGLIVVSIEGKALAGDIRVAGRIWLKPRLPYDLSLVLDHGSSKELASLAGLSGFSLLGSADLDSRLTGDLDGAVLEGRAVLGGTKAFAEVACLPLELHLESLSGAFLLSPRKIQLGPFEGSPSDRRLALEFHTNPRDADGSWRLRLEARDLDAAALLAHHLARPDRVSARLGGSLLVSGRGRDRGAFIASGSLRGDAVITDYEALGHLEAEYHLRGLHDIEIEEFATQVFVHSGRIKLQDLIVRSSHGDARGELEIGILECDIEGTAELAMERRVLGGARRFLSLFEGGPRYNVGITLGGTVLAPTLVYASH